MLSFTTKPYKTCFFTCLPVSSSKLSQLLQVGLTSFSRHNSFFLHGLAHQAGRDSRKLIRMYNKMAKTLVEFETLWYQVGGFSKNAMRLCGSKPKLYYGPKAGRIYGLSFLPADFWHLLCIHPATWSTMRPGSAASKQ